MKTNYLQAMRDALEALLTFELCEPSDIKQTITNLRNAIAECEKQEPVAWKDTMHTEHGDGSTEEKPLLLGYEGWERLPDGAELYLHPPLSDEPVRLLEECRSSVKFDLLRYEKQSVAYGQLGEEGSQIYAASEAEARRLFALLDRIDAVTKKDAP